MKTKQFLLFLYLFIAVAGNAVSAVNSDGIRLKDLGHIDGWRDNALVGYGLVTGLAGTGDSSRNRATKQSIANVLSQFGMTIGSDQINSRNVAAVMVTATLPPFAREGGKLDVIVTSVGDARSLLGGTLLLTPLRGPDNRVHALAQGPISVGGYKYDMNGNVVQKNHPTVGTIPAGANIELGVSTQVVQPQGKVIYVLTMPDYTTANRIARSVNAAFSESVAHAKDASSIEISLPPRLSQGDAVAFITKLENVTVEPDQRAKVVINERTGMVVSGGDVRISQVTISQGDLKVSIVTENLVSQPIFVRQTGPDVRTEVVPNTRIDVTETGMESVSLPAANNTVAELVRALSKIKTSTRDMISILQGIKAAGALHAELIIQ